MSSVRVGVCQRLILDTHKLNPVIGYSIRRNNAKGTKEKSFVPFAFLLLFYANRPMAEVVIIAGNETGPLMEKSDRTLVDESISGNLNSFDALMLRYERLVYSVAFHYAREREAALDITQNVFLKAYENLRSLREGPTFKPWLMKIAYHESINWLRKNRRRKEEDALERGEWVTARDDQERNFLEEEAGTTLHRCIRSLNPKHRMAVVLRYFDEMPLAEIASVLKCSEGLVKNILFRSLKRLRREMVQS
jgi:RNA polymerase sigma-70 factor, ECF subfamily